MRYVDLFCGMGSFAAALDALGGECVLACDACPSARRVYERNHGLLPAGKVEDIDAQAVPDHAILCAGFPCQPFSRAGPKNGFADPRGTLFSHVLRILAAKQPALVLLENVPALRTHDEGRTFRAILGWLDEAGYETEHAVLLASDYGCPQTRRRLFIAGRRRGACTDGGQGEGGGARWSVLGGVSAFRARVTLSDLLGLPFERPFAFTIRCGGRLSGVDNRHNWDRYRLSDGTTYTLKVEDALSIQGFSPSFFDGCGLSARQKWRLLGNTIPTAFTRAIAHCAMAALPASAAAQGETTRASLHHLQSAV